MLLANKLIFKKLYLEIYVVILKIIYIIIKWKMIAGRFFFYWMYLLKDILLHLMRMFFVNCS